MPGLRNRIFKYIRRIVLIFALLVAALYFLGGLGPIQRLALEYARKAFRARSGLDLTVAETEGNLSHHLTLSGVKIEGVALIKSLEIRYNPLSVLRRRFRITSIHIEHPSFNLDQLLKLQLKEGEGKPPGVDIVSFSVDGGEIVYRERVIPFLLSLSLRSGRLDIAELSLNLPNSRLAASGTYEIGGDLGFLYDLGLDLADLEMGEGRLSSVGEVSGTASTPVARGSFDFSSARLGNLSLAYLYQEDSVGLSDLTIHGQKYELSGSANLSLKAKSGDVNLSGTVAGEKVRIEGKYVDGQLDVATTGRLHDLLITGTVDKKVDLSLSGHYQKQQVHGRIGYHNRRLNGSVRAASLTAIQDLSLNGLDLSFDFDLAEGRPAGQGIVTVGDIRYTGRKLGSISLRAELRDEEVIADMSGLLKGKGKLSLGPQRRFRFSFSLEDFDVGGFAPDVTGRMTASVKARGSLSQLRRTDVSVVVTSLSSKVRGLQLSSSGPIRIGYYDSRVTVGRSRLVVDGSEVLIAGSMSLGGPGKVDFSVSARELALRILSPFVPYQVIGGVLDVDMKLTGVLSDPEYSGKIDVRELCLAVQKDTIGPIDLSVELDKHLLNVEELAVQLKDWVIVNEGPIIVDLTENTVSIRPARVMLGGRPISFSGTLPFAQPGQLDFELSTSGLDLRILSLLLPYEVTAGQLDADIALSGAYTRPEFYGGIKVRDLSLVVQEDTIGPIGLETKLVQDLIEIDSLNVLLKKNVIANEGPILVELKEGSASMRPAKIRLGEKFISFAGVIPLNSGRELDLTVNADSLDLSILGSMLPRMGLEGFLSVALTAKGTRARPEITGNAALSSVLVTVPRDTIGPISGGILFSKEGVGFQQLRIAYGKGVVHASGELGLDRRASLTIAVRRVIIPVMKRSSVQIDGDLQLTGSEDASTLGGELVVSGSYVESIEAQMIGRALNRINRPPKRLPEFLRSIDLNVGLTTDYMVSNTAADVKVAGDLQITGNVARPGVTGQVRIREGGRVGYFGRNFTIENGTVDFIDPRAISPNLDVSAKSAINHEGVDYLITLLVTGPPDNIHIELSSQPEMAKQEIIALVITGQTRGVNQLPASQSVGGKAVEYLIGRMKGRVADSIARTLGLERVTITGPITDPALLKMGVEKRIRKGLKVSYTRGFENWKQQLVGVDYEISRNLSIYSIYDLENIDSGAGIDLHMKLW